MVFRRKHACHMLSLCHCQNGLMMIEVDWSWLIWVMMIKVDWWSFCYRCSTTLLPIACFSDGAPSIVVAQRAQRAQRPACLLLEVTDQLRQDDDSPKLTTFVKYEMKIEAILCQITCQLLMYEWIGLRSLRMFKGKSSPETLVTWFLLWNMGVSCSCSLKQIHSSGDHLKWPLVFPEATSRQLSWPRCVTPCSESRWDFKFWEPGMRQLGLDLKMLGLPIKHGDFPRVFFRNVGLIFPMIASNFS